MEMMRQKWSDERLDDLNGRVSEGFRESREETRALRADTKSEFRALRSEMNARFDAIDTRFAAMQRALLQVGGGIVAGMVGLIVTQL